MIDRTDLDSLDEEILDLRDEATTHGDLDLVDVIDRWIWSGDEEAGDQIAETLENARAMEVEK